MLSLEDEQISQINLTGPAFLLYSRVVLVVLFLFFANIIIYSSSNHTKSDTQHLASNYLPVIYLCLYIIIFTIAFKIQTLDLDNQVHWKKQKIKVKHRCFFSTTTEFVLMLLLFLIQHLKTFRFGVLLCYVTQKGSTKLIVSITIYRIIGLDPGKWSVFWFQICRALEHMLI